MPPFVTHADLRQALAVDAAKKPDIVKGTYVAPDGARGKHIIKLKCSDREVAVSGPPRQTFKPGTSVLAASHQNGQHRTMLAYPVGARGASQYQAAVQHRQARMAPGFGPTSCPISITGKTYLGLYHDGADLLLWSYADGVYVEDVATIAAAAAPHYYSACKVPGESIIAYHGALGEIDGVFAWNYAEDTLDYWNSSSSISMGMAATSNHLYAVVAGQLWRLDLDCGNPTEVGDVYSSLGLWVANDFALYSQRDDGAQKLGHHDGTTPADPWTLTSRALIADGGDYDNLTVGSSVIGLDTLVRYHRIGAGAGGAVTTLQVVAGAETPLWPAHWRPGGTGNRALLGVGNDDVTVYDSGSYVRLALTDYTTVETACAWPSIEVEQHPIALATPGAFIPLD